MFSRIGTVLGVLATFSFSLLAQESIELTKIMSPIELDGIADEEAWKSVPYFEPVQYEPVFKGEMGEVTRFKVAYDDNYIYAFGELYTKDPSTITVNSLVRDQYSNDDIFAFVVDGFNDKQNATWFFVNPDGVRFDIAVSNDANGGDGRSATNFSWNTFWDIETQITSEGWFAEMRVPFSSIGVQVNDNGETEMGIILYRLDASKNERHIFPAIAPVYDRGFAKPSQAQNVTLKGLKSKNPVYITPYGLTGINRNSSLSSDSTNYNFDGDIKKEVGFDLRYNLTNNLTFDLSVNTDFAQVEADDQQLNLSRFSLFFPEKRQFFQQRAGLFDYSYGSDRVFYSRRIGLDESGNPVRILGGGRVTGRIGKTEVGIINMQTGSSDNLSSENLGIIRLKQQVWNETSYVGGIFTSKVDAEGNSNLVYGIDTNINTFGDHFIEVRSAQSVDNSISESIRTDLSETTAIRVSILNLTTNGLFYELMYTRLSDNYNPGLGFVRLNGVTQKFARLGYGWFAKEESLFLRNTLRVQTSGRFYNGENDLLSLTQGIQSITTSARWEARFKQLGVLTFNLNRNIEDVPIGEGFNLLSRIYIPSNKYTYSRFEASYNFPQASKVNGRINGVIGTFMDGEIREFNISPRFFASRKIEIGGSYRLTNLQFPKVTRERILNNDFEDVNRDKLEFTSHLVQFKGQYSLNKKMSISSFIQYSNVAELAGANIRLRYNFREGQDFWIVINEQVYMDRNQQRLGLPDLPFMQSGSILVKYNHTFIF